MRQTFVVTDSLVAAQVVKLSSGLDGVHLQVQEESESASIRGRTLRHRLRDPHIAIGCTRARALTPLGRLS